MADAFKLVSDDGDTFVFDYVIKGDANINCFNAQLVVDIPVGISLIGPLISPTSTDIAVPKGYYVVGTDTWLIGDLSAGEEVLVAFEFQVDDISLADPLDGRFFVQFTLTSDCTESDPLNNLLTLTIGTTPEVCDATVTIGSIASSQSGSLADVTIG